MTTIITADEKRLVDIGTSDTIFALYSTAKSLLGNKKNISDGIEFLKSGTCKWHDCLCIARQINLIRDQLSQHAPAEIVYDINHPEIKAPWINNLSPVVTSCGNLFTTADGKDLLYEIVSILCYAAIKKCNIKCIG